MSDLPLTGEVSNSKLAAVFDTEAAARAAAAAVIAQTELQPAQVKVVTPDEPHPGIKLEPEGGGILRTIVVAHVWLGVAGRYPAPRVNHRFKDGDTIRVGPVALTAHITGGHTRGCTSWSFPVRDGDRVLNVVSVCPLGAAPLGMRYAEERTQIERSLRVLRSLPADIWVTSSSRSWGRYKKFVASKGAKNPVDAFIDPDGYRTYIDNAEAEFR
jgi:glyoxylase-like metal-dependent hydrolase (beta-lactamase superfamily II)